LNVILLNMLIFHILGSYNNTSSVKQSDWIIITWIDKKTRLGGQVKWINKDTNIVRQLNFTRQIQRMTIQDGTIQVNK